MMRRRRGGEALAAVLLAAVGAGAGTPAEGAGQSGPAAAEVVDEAAAAQALWQAAVDHRLERDDDLVSYTAVVRQRVGAGLRLPLKDRTLYRAESAHRVFWQRNGDLLIQVLALREQTPLGVQESTSHGMFDQNFDPMDDRLLFGLVDGDEDAFEEDPDDFWFEHPLEPGYRDHYVLSIGDTLTLSLGSGERLRAVELQVVPTVADVHRMTGSLWIEPGTGALVRAVYRLSDTFDAMRDIPDLAEEDEKGEFRFVPSLFKPWTAEIRMIAVDYALWDFQVWLPRSLRAEGVITAGILSAPASIDITYEMESVVTEADLEAPAAVEEQVFATRSDAMAELARRTVGDVPYVLEPGWTRVLDGDDRRRGRGRERTRVRYLVPEDPDWLRRSPDLPPPIWESAPGFVSDDEVSELFEVLGGLPVAPVQGIPRTFRWGPQRPDLLRYNRVEGLSVGARGQLRPQTFLGPLSLTATARIGWGDLHPNARLDVVRERLARRVTVSAFHELAPVDEDARHLGLGNSLTAGLFGRDDGEYYRRSGAWLSWTPPTAERRTYEVRGYAEYHRAAETGTDAALWRVTDSEWRFRPNLVAAEGWEAGARVRVAPWWGTDPRMVQGGLEWVGQAAGGDWEYARTSLEGRLAVPLFADLRLGLEAGGGTSWGSPPPQRAWFLGGASSLRGYGPSVAVGRRFLRGRGELARQYAFGAVSLFGDAGWAGSAGVDPDDILYALGAGVSLVDGLIRLDAAWGLADAGSFRLELYLDGIL
ncbi:MAG: hypothetical protein RH859_00220 [Longimicrobiales bacterium]